MQIKIKLHVQKVALKTYNYTGRDTGLKTMKKKRKQDQLKRWEKLTALCCRTTKTCFLWNNGILVSIIVGNGPFTCTLSILILLIINRSAKFLSVWSMYCHWGFFRTIFYKCLVKTSVTLLPVILEYVCNVYRRKSF